MTTTNTKLELNWENLLTEAVTKPGKILAAYSLFHNYSLANAMLALIQCEMHGIQPGPINTFPGWKALGRHVIKGQKGISPVMPITCKKRHEENQQAADAADVGKDVQSHALSADGSLLSIARSNHLVYTEKQYRVCAVHAFCAAIGFVAPQEMLAGRRPQISPHATANSTPHA